jgi:hypothetical protein
MDNESIVDKDKTALLHVSRPTIPKDAAILVETHKAEMAAAHEELRRRLKEFRLAQEKEKEEWVFLNLQKACPLWAVRSAMLKRRGWVLRLFGVTVDHVGFSRYVEMFEIRKRGRLVAIKLFRWDSGDHMEGAQK